MFAADAVAPAGTAGWRSVHERAVGGFRIYAGALDADSGGYNAAVEVHRVHGDGRAPEVVYSSRRTAGAHRFDDAAAAVRHALDIGHQAVRSRDAAAR